MKRNDLFDMIALGEDSTRQFKADVRNADSLASEMAAFANAMEGSSLLAWRTTVRFRGFRRMM